MKIIDRKGFLGLPAETLFSKYEPSIFDPLEIKGDSLIFNPDGSGDFCSQQIHDAIDSHSSGDFGNKLDDALELGKSLTMDFDCQGRDGCFDQDQLFAVWEKKDVVALIGRLEKLL